MKNGKIDLKKRFVDARELLETIYEARVNELIEYYKDAKESNFHSKFANKGQKAEFIRQMILIDEHLKNVTQCMGLLTCIEHEQGCFEKIRKYNT